MAQNSLLTGKNTVNFLAATAKLIEFCPKTANFPWQAVN
jgi:hypothetical protein